MNKLILGDCLEVLSKFDSESVDLIYLDPPFFSNRNYEVIWGDKGEIRSFKDRWSGGIDHYISWLKERVAEMHRVLKQTGSIYLHCDYHADAYIRVYILDKIMNFQNNIVWFYGGGNSSKKKWARKYDNILFYSKHRELFAYNYEQLGRNNPEKARYKYEDENGLYRWHRENIKDYKIYLKPMNLNDVWEDIGTVKGNAEEYIGYPTQKPEKLLERIILASSNEGDIVLDPFVGGGTTIAVADRLKRNWIGIDQSVQAIKVSEMRLNKLQGCFSKPFTVMSYKNNYDLSL